MEIFIVQTAVFQDKVRVPELQKNELDLERNNYYLTCRKYQYQQPTDEVQ